MTLTNEFNQPADLHLVVRMSKPGDEQMVRDFYGTFKHEFVDDRDQTMLDKYTADGRVILFLNKDNGQPVASSIALSHNIDPAKKAPTKKAAWTEVGATHITLGGFNLSSFMVSAQIMNEMFKRPPVQFFFADIYKTNSKASTLLSKVIGWDFFVPNDDLWDSTGFRHEEHLLDWLRCTTKTLPQQAKLLLETMDNPKIVNHKTGQAVHLDLSEMGWLKTRRKALENIATGPVSAVLLDPAANQNIDWAATQMPKRTTAKKSGPVPQP
ncbi:hypothetical protein [Micavibrio aeruginosavorus]|uniref:N-acetyltransferase domain-containing protein n=1 Tax=Micavibrio aeruginosavorus EPB TaxID=349215 RepID=M4VWC1_9BACT|nr:hypothetical protein [Micavibrio aeruginosavorus]AGH97469.1 hypothetical protein A11S_645 [Micavibrio aeruginosavorus EPB]